MRLHSSRDMSSNMGHIVIAENTKFLVVIKRLYTFKHKNKNKLYSREW